MTDKTSAVVKSLLSPDEPSLALGSSAPFPPLLREGRGRLRQRTRVAVARVGRDQTSKVTRQDLLVNQAVGSDLGFGSSGLGIGNLNSYTGGTGNTESVEKILCVPRVHCVRSGLSLHNRGNQQNRAYAAQNQALGEQRFEGKPYVELYCVAQRRGCP